MLCDWCGSLKLVTIERMENVHIFFFVCHRMLLVAQAHQEKVIHFSWFHYLFCRRCRSGCCRFTILLLLLLLLLLLQRCHFGLKPRHGFL
jgi:hypothetical protein